MVGHNKGKKYKIINNETDKILLKGLVSDAITVKARYNGKLPHDYINNIVNKHQTKFSCKLTKDRMFNAIRKHERKKIMRL